MTLNQEKSEIVKKNGQYHYTRIEMATPTCIYIIVGINNSTSSGVCNYQYVHFYQTECVHTVMSQIVARASISLVRS